MTEYASITLTEFMPLEILKCSNNSADLTATFSDLSELIITGLPI